MGRWSVEPMVELSMDIFGYWCFKLDSFSVVKRPYQNLDGR